MNKNAFTLAEVSSTHCAGARKTAFTLAEVLITLGIIGVVAAMTMPTLMNSTQGAQYKTAFKKALSALSQAITLNMALDDVNFASITQAGDAGVTTKKSDNDTVASVLNSRMNIVKAAKGSEAGYGVDADDATLSTFPAKVPTEVCTGSGEEKTCTEEQVVPDTFLFFNDGIMFAYKAADAVNCTEGDKVDTDDDNYCYGVVDVNGTKGPNKIVACDQGATATDANCTVTNPTDIYPVVFYDQTVLPASPAAKAVLYGK